MWTLLLLLLLLTRTWCRGVVGAGRQAENTEERREERNSTDRQTDDREQIAEDSFLYEKNDENRKIQRELRCTR